MWEKYEWTNKPKQVVIEENQLYFKTERDTDFWRNTHYHFNRMNGHAFLREVEAQAFTCRLKIRMEPKHKYDQAGIYLCRDDDHWLKTSVEFIPDGPSHLGAVVTSYGYSDWSTRNFSNQDVRDILEFEIEYDQGDVQVFFLHRDGTKEQLRIAHLHRNTATETVKIGPYACSPNLDQSGCPVEVLEFEVSIR